MTSRPNSVPTATDITPELSQKISDGFLRSVELAQAIIEDTDTPPYVRVQAMNFFAKNRHLANDGQSSEAQDKFMKLMTSIRDVPNRKLIVTEDKIIDELDDDDNDLLVEEVGAQSTSFAS